MKHRDQSLEGPTPRFDASKLQRERRIARLDRNRLGDQKIPGVDPLVHQMPGDAMLVGPIQQRPGRRVQPRVSGQRSIVEVDDASGGVVDHLGRQDAGVEDAENPVARLAAQRRERGADRFGPHPATSGFRGERVAAGKTGRDLETRLEQAAEHALGDHGIADQGDSNRFRRLSGHHLRASSPRVRPLRR